MYKRKDAFYTRAKATGFRSRAAFKLVQLVQRTQLLRRGACVVDLGAWPGGWLQVAAQQVGPSGRVVGVDLQPVEPLAEKNVSLVCGDISDPRVQQQVAQLCGGRADVILSDLAPRLSGVKARDEAQAQALADSVLEWANALLKPEGTLVVKLFMSDELPRYLRTLRERFREVRTTRPEATRKGSAEIYAIARGFVAPN